MNAPTRPWEAMTDAERHERLLPLLERMTYAAAAKVLGAPSRNAVSGVISRVKNGAAGKTTKPRNQISPAPERKTTGHAPRSTGSNGANPGGDNVDRSASARPSGQKEPGTQLPSVEGSSILERNTSGPDAKRAPNSSSPSSPSTSSRSETPAGAAESPPSAVPALLSVKDSRSNKKVRGGKPNTNRIAAVRSKSEASIDRHIARRMKARIETPKIDPGLPITITKAAAFDPLPGVEPVALVDIPAFGRCRWPVEPDAPGHFMCGAPCDATAKYCCAHKRLSISPYQPQTRKAAA